MRVSRIADRSQLRQYFGCILKIMGMMSERGRIQLDNIIMELRGIGLSNYAISQFIDGLRTTRYTLDCAEITVGKCLFGGLPTVTRAH